MSATDPRVDAYIAARPAWQQAICVCALLAAKEHVNVFLYDGANVPDPGGSITGVHGNKTARTVAYPQGETINAPALLAMLREIIANNRGDG
jgi:hypothetical protein